MKLFEKVTLGLLFAGLLITVGCSSDKYPDELSLEDAPETIAEAFKDEKERQYQGNGHPGNAVAQG